MNTTIPQSLEEKQAAIKNVLGVAGKDNNRYVNPDLMMWQFVQRLTSTDPKDIYTLTELSNEEIICVANYLALSEFLQLQDVPTNRLVFAEKFFYWVMTLRPSLQRKSRNELVTILKRKPSYYGASMMGGMPGDEDNPKKWYEFWKK